MPQMPYAVAKGRLWNIVEDYLSDATRSLDFLRFLENGGNVWDSGALDSLEMPFPPLQMRSHVNVHWTRNNDIHFDGMVIPNPWDPTRPFVFNVPYDAMRATGWWVDWNGPAAEILREMLIRAIRLSFGLGRAEPIPNNSVAAPAPIEFSWVCGGHIMQAWVSWKGNDSHRHVSVTLLTPMFTSPYAPTDLNSPMWSGVLDNRLHDTFANVDYDTLGMFQTGMQDPAMNQLTAKSVGDYSEAPDSPEDATADQGLIAIGQGFTESFVEDQNCIPYLGQIEIPAYLVHSVPGYEQVAVVRTAVLAEGLPSFQLPYRQAAGV